MSYAIIDLYCWLYFLQIIMRMVIKFIEIFLHSKFCRYFNFYWWEPKLLEDSNKEEYYYF